MKHLNKIMIVLVGFYRGCFAVIHANHGFDFYAASSTGNGKALESMNDIGVFVVGRNADCYWKEAVAEWKIGANFRLSALFLRAID